MFGAFHRARKNHIFSSSKDPCSRTFSTKSIHSFENLGFHFLFSFNLRAALAQVWIAKVQTPGVAALDGGNELHFVSPPVPVLCSRAAQQPQHSPIPTALPEPGDLWFRKKKKKKKECLMFCELTMDKAIVGAVKESSRTQCSPGKPELVNELQNIPDRKISNLHKHDTLIILLIADQKTYMVG